MSVNCTDWPPPLVLNTSPWNGKRARKSGIGTGTTPGFIPEFQPKEIRTPTSSSHFIANGLLSFSTGKCISHGIPKIMGCTNHGIPKIVGCTSCGMHKPWDPKNHGIHGPWDPQIMGSHKSWNSTNHGIHGQWNSQITGSHKPWNSQTVGSINHGTNCENSKFQQFQWNIPNIPKVTLMSWLWISTLSPALSATPRNSQGNFN